MREIMERIAAAELEGRVLLAAARRTAERTVAQARERTEAGRAAALAAARAEAARALDAAVEAAEGERAAMLAAETGRGGNGPAPELRRQAAARLAGLVLGDYLRGENAGKRGP